MDSFSQFGEWTWITLGIALLGLELLAPGTFFMWLGLAALGVGAIAFFTDLSWQIELVLFGVLALVLVIAGRRFFARQGDETTDTPGLNERGKSHLGREITLAEPLVGGTGRVKIGDTMWRIEGPDLPAGARVRVSAVRGAMLEVEHVQPE
jgi:membrane protein implicated in regulation of membrane protease activity